MLHRRCVTIALIANLFCGFAGALFAQTNLFIFAPPPADNPLRGLVPYPFVERVDNVPHSLEFFYVSARELAPAPDQFEFAAIEKQLRLINERGCQGIFRIFLEYPGKPLAVPQFLVEDGLRIHRYKNADGEHQTPDYSDPKLLRFLKSLIESLGETYDGDPRVGSITAGLLGHWGEWHTYPREDLYPPKATQTSVMNAYDRAFAATPILLRYPAGPANFHYADNSQTRFGYHDDSFAWATLDTGRDEESWFFMSAMKAAGASERWKHAPVGGEIRPELWPCLFTDKGCDKGQNFDKAVRETHASWLMDTGLFTPSKHPTPPKRLARAKAAVANMGYVYTATQFEREGDEIALTIENRGVAPFYQDWPVKLALISREKTILKDTPWKLAGLLPGQTRTWRASVPKRQDQRVAIAVPNPMPNGKPLRFANKEQGPLWLVLEP